MEKLRKLFCIFLSLCIATMACIYWIDPVSKKGGRNGFRTIGPRLTTAKWQACCRKAEILPSCDESGDALELLVTADTNCIDTALNAVQRRAKDDLAAAYYIRGQRTDDPVDYLRAWKAAEDALRKNPASNAARFNRALTLEKLGLRKEAILAWDDVVKLDEPGWSNEARAHRNHLQQMRGPEWPADELEAALRQHDRAALTKLVRAFPSNSNYAFEESNLLDVKTSSLFADALNEPYARSIVNAVSRTSDRGALEQGIHAFRQARTLERNGKTDKAVERYQQAVRLLERAGNPLSLAARYEIAAYKFSVGEDSLALLDAIVPLAEQHAYHNLFAIHALRANALEYQDRYLEAHKAYDQAIASARLDPTAIVAALTRRSENYARIGSPKLAFRDSFKALTLLPHVANLNARHHAYASAATAARQLDYPTIALRYQTAAVEAILKGVTDARAGQLSKAKHHLAVALSSRAELYVDLDRENDAHIDLQQATDLAGAMEDPKIRAQLQSRIKEVSGQASFKTNPKKAMAEFSEAMNLTRAQDSTNRAVLYYERAMARRRAGDQTADQDIDRALNILRDEAANLVDRSKRGAHEILWTPYFSRFQAMHHDMIEGRIAENDRESAFVYAEQARGFEPMHLILQSRSAVPGFRKIQTKGDLAQHLDTLSEDMVILQYLVLKDHTYTWILTRDHIELLRQRPGVTQIASWVEDIGAAIKSSQSDPIERVMRAAYEELFAKPLSMVPARSQKRIVIVPDGPMHGLPFAALRSKERDVIEQSSIAVAGSTSLYLYALERDRQFQRNPSPMALIIGDPERDLAHARDEAEQLGSIYENATLLRGAEATVPNFLALVGKAAIIHFAGHGIANPQDPSRSMLHFNPHGDDSGELTAGKLMAELSELERTRLVVLAACSSAGGVSVGPEGVAPLVRPLIAANVPAVVGTLWDVNDATVKKLLVSLHCHYRHGDDVAVALQQAQLEMLRNQEPARTWAAFQVVGYAGSPYASHAAMENTHSEHVCTQNSLHGPDGLHPQ